MKEISKDLADEGQALDDIVAEIDDDAWNTVTTFGDWTVKDEIAHLAYFDWFARLSATDKEAFNAEMNKLAMDPDNFFQNTLKPGQSKSNVALLEWWRTERKAMIMAYSACDPKERLPWYIPMSARSSATARLMETWAHGQDVVDALGVERPATDRLKHIAHLGVATFGWSFQCRGLEVPEKPVRVELASPSGELWTWGPGGADDRIDGAAQDFCLVVVQRRHYLDTHLRLQGEVAEKWMSVAQAFAGPPAAGPPSGTFPKLVS